MTKEELAQQYADEIIKNHLKQIIQESFLKGYELGELHTALTIKIDEVTYVDLGLPSGTLWSSTPFCRGNGGFYERLCYNDAKNLNIPTEEQCKELISKSRMVYDAHFTSERFFSNTEIFVDRSSIEMIGSTGMRISCTSKASFVGEGLDDQSNKNPLITSYYKNGFWITSNPDTSDNAQILVLDALRKTINIQRYFMGYKLPIFLVKNKGEV